MGYKTFWEKEKMLVTRIFSFSHNVCNRLSPKGHQKSCHSVVKDSDFSAFSPPLGPQNFQNTFCSELLTHFHTMTPFNAPGKQAF